jgi:hypothetical protein
MDASHFEGEVSGVELGKDSGPLRADGIRVPKVEGVQSSQAAGGVRDESYRGWSGYRKAGCFNCIG